MDMLKRVIDGFKKTFKSDPAFIARAPGRVNLLGEHIDYNDGWVLPAALDRATYLAVGPGATDVVTLKALDLNASIAFRLDDLEAKIDTAGQPLPDWACYPAGVAWALKEAGLAIKGMQGVYTSDVPRGSGLSSSASVEVTFATAWQQLGGWARTPMELARLCQRAENKYVGMHCGLMDQFAAACGQAGHVLLLDCRTLEWQAVPLPPGLVVVVADTLVRHTLTGSEYNVRRAACEEAVKILSGPLPGIKALRDVSMEDFNRHAELLAPIVQQRARFVVEECARTQQAVKLLPAGQAAEFGQLMNACHAGLRDLYEVSCPELDVMVAAAQKIEGCYGARLTGAGFGGCTVNLVAAAAAENFTRELARHYQTATGKQPEIFVCHPSAGAQVLAV